MKNIALLDWLKTHSENPYCEQILTLLNTNEYSDKTLKDCLNFHPPKEGYELLLQATAEE